MSPAWDSPLPGASLTTTLELMYRKIQDVMSPACDSPQPGVCLAASLDIGLAPATRTSNYQPGTQVSKDVKPYVSSLGLATARRIPNG